MCMAAVALVACQGSADEIRLKVIDPLRTLYGRQDVERAGGFDVLRMAGPRNGFCSAQVVATGEGLDGVRVEVSDLGNGASVIPARAVLVRYADKEPGYRLELPKKGVHNFTEAYYDRLHVAPPAGADILPVWLTVAIPADAAPGTYRGELRVGGGAVPIRLDVGSWVCPDPGDWVTHVGIVSSPEVLALQYGVEFWSDEHWALIERSMKLRGALGNDDLWLHGLAALGFQTGQMAQLRFRRDGDAIEPDFRIVDRHMDLYARHVGRPQYILLNIWAGRPDRRRKGGASGVTVIVDGEKASVPRPEAEGGEAVWRPLLEGLRQRVVARGWSEDSILLALASDSVPRDVTVAALRKYAPYARWAIWSHGRGGKPIWAFAPDEELTYANGMRIGYYVHPNTPGPRGWIRRPDRQVQMGEITGGIQGGWNQERPIYASMRNDLHKYAALSQWRCLANGSMLGNRAMGFGDDKGGAGFAFVWLDFWRVKGDGYYFSFQPFVNRLTDVMTRSNSPSLVWPAPDGPRPTVRYEMLREGLQEAEARVALERAVVVGAVTGEPAERCKGLLKEMFAVRYKGGEFAGGHAGSSLGAPNHMWGVHDYPEWLDFASRLFDLAGQVQGGAPPTPSPARPVSRPAR